MAGKYSNFRSVKSGNNQTFKGALPLDGQNAAAFQYQKSIVVDVFLSNFGGTVFRDLKGDWKIQLKASPSEDAKVLFEQRIEWTARVVAIGMGPFSLVTWQPLGDGGAGKQQTSICNGQECAVIEEPSIATDEEWQAYGETGAWRFLDNPTIRPSMTPQQKYNAEKGFTIFRDEGVATSGTYSFFATWQNAIIGYNCDIPSTAVLQIVYDRWQFASLQREAAYQFAFKLGQAASQMLWDRHSGEHWLFYSDGGKVKTQRHRRLQGGTVSEGIEVEIDDSSPSVIVPAKFGGTMRVFLGGTDGLRVSQSHDAGYHWEKTMIVTDKVSVIGGAGDASGGVFYGFGKAAREIEETDIKKDDKVYLWAKQSGNGSWQIDRIQKIRFGSADPFDKTFVSITSADDIFWAWFRDGDELECWQITDGFLKWEKIEAVG